MSHNQLRVKVLVVGNNPFSDDIAQTIKKYGRKVKLQDILRPPQNLPPFLEDIEFMDLSPLKSCDLTIIAVNHPDVAYFMGEEITNINGRAILASDHVIERQIKLDQQSENILTPKILCSLETQKDNVFGTFTREFGKPEYKLVVKSNKIEDVIVLRGAPCGSTWKIVENLKKKSVEDAPRIAGLSIQYYCHASRGLTVTGRRGKIYTGAKIHSEAIKKALMSNRTE